MPRKPHVRPRVEVKSLDRSRPDVLKMVLFNPHTPVGATDRRFVEIEVIGKEDGSMELRMWNLASGDASAPLSQPSRSSIVVQIPPAP